MKFPYPNSRGKVTEESNEASCYALKPGIIFSRGKIKGIFAGRALPDKQFAGQTIEKASHSRFSLNRVDYLGVFESDESDKCQELNSRNERTTC